MGMKVTGHVGKPLVWMGCLLGDPTTHSSHGRGPGPYFHFLWDWLLLSAYMRAGRPIIYQEQLCPCGTLLVVSLA